MNINHPGLCHAYLAKKVIDPRFGNMFDCCIKMFEVPHFSTYSSLTFADTPRDRFPTASVGSLVGAEVI
jgi:hypothetical protein